MPLLLSFYAVEGWKGLSSFRGEVVKTYFKSCNIPEKGRRFKSRRLKNFLLFPGNGSAPDLFQEAALVQVFDKGVVKDLRRLFLDACAPVAGNFN